MRSYVNHGKTGTHAYFSWRNMLNRCYWQRGPDYSRYGGRGIFVCERWRVFENFYSDMGDPPEGLQIERIDNNGPYSPENCIWASRYVQSRNRRSNRLIFYNGKILTLKDWSDKLGFKYTTLRQRIESGWPIKRAFTEPTK